MQTNSSRGFTLIELLVVITIIAILASFAFPAYTNVQERAKATTDLNNLRQIGIATQLFLNDNDNTFFQPTDPDWMTSLHPKYLSAWKIFQSPFDKRTPTESDSNSPVSYGFNANAHSTTGALSSDKVINPSSFILYAPAQNATVATPFTGTASASVSVSKDSIGPGGVKAGGTHSRGSHINACMADLHVENLLWTDFHSDAPDSGSSYAVSSRWHPDPANP
jgi:prepilin-type N-terminal cleavage/methylation domain-containing protein